LKISAGAISQLPPLVAGLALALRLDAKLVFQNNKAVFQIDLASRNVAYLQNCAQHEFKQSNMLPEKLTLCMPHIPQ